MTDQLPHYLRLHRKRAGLSQDELGRLLGVTTGGKVSRYECFSREPTLRTAFAYEALFGVPASELFAGIFASSKASLAGPAAAALKELQRIPTNAHRAALIARLAALTAGSDTA